MEVYDEIDHYMEYIGTACVSPNVKEINKEGPEYQKVIVHPSRVNRMGRTDVCIMQHG
jgi:glycine betaine/choline ABC-type transport system substrate-binding protein